MLRNSQIKQCNKCGAEIVFAQSSGGKWYPADIDRGSGKSEMAYTSEGGILPGKKRSLSYPTLHRCALTRDAIESTINQLKAQLAEQEQAVADGDWFDGRDSTREAIKAWEQKLLNNPVNV
jgi:hypothetical protein